MFGLVDLIKKITTSVRKAGADLVESGRAIGSKALRSIGGRRGSDVGSKIRKAFINFVTDASDDWNAASSNGTSQLFIIKGSEVISAAATTQNCDYLNVSMLVEVFKPRG